jgi:aryl-alcohol dehydrogenase-like predicted oxidoreductase
MESSKSKQPTIPRRAYGRSGEGISILGFGGLMLNRMAPAEANQLVADAVARGISYFDVGPSYGTSEERLGEGLEPFRDDIFLACKTLERDAGGAREELTQSLKNLRTDRLDLYQLHALNTLEEVDLVFAPGGAMEVFLEAREAGIVRHLGFSSHTDEAAVALLERFDFDSVMFPINFACWMKHGFGKATHEACHEHTTTLIAIKALAFAKRPEGDSREEYPNCWYRPLTDPRLASLAMRFTLARATAALSPANDQMLRLALDIAPATEEPLTPEEEGELAAHAETLDAVFGS